MDGEAGIDGLTCPLAAAAKGAGRGGLLVLPLLWGGGQSACWGVWSRGALLLREYKGRFRVPCVYICVSVCVRVKWVVDDDE